MNADSIQSQLDTVNKAIDVNIKYVMQNEWARASIHLLIVLYAARLAPNLPKQVTDLFTNTYFKIFVFFVILWTAKAQPHTALLIAIAFLMTTNYATTGKLWEGLENMPAAAQARALAAAPAQAPAQVADQGARPAAAPAAAPALAAPAQAIQPAARPAAAPAQVIQPAARPAAAPAQVAAQAAAPAAAPAKAAPAQAIQPAARPAAAPAQAIQPAARPAAAPAPAPAKAAPASIPAPALGKAPQAQAPAPGSPAPAASAQLDSGCFPQRRYDLSKVTGYTASDPGSPFP